MNNAFGHFKKMDSPLLPSVLNQNQWLKSSSIEISGEFYEFLLFP